MQATLNDHVIAQSDDIVEAAGYAYFPASRDPPGMAGKAPKTASDLECPHGVQFYDVAAGRQPASTRRVVV